MAFKMDSRVIQAARQVSVTTSPHLEAWPASSSPLFAGKWRRPATQMSRAPNSQKVSKPLKYGYRKGSTMCELGCRTKAWLHCRHARRLVLQGLCPVALLSGLSRKREAETEFHARCLSSSTPRILTRCISLPRAPALLGFFARRFVFSVPCSKTPSLSDEHLLDASRTPASSLSDV